MGLLFQWCKKSIGIGLFCSGNRKVSSLHLIYVDLPLWLYNPVDRLYFMISFHSNIFYHGDEDAVSV